MLVVDRARIELAWLGFQSSALTTLAIYPLVGVTYENRTRNRLDHNQELYLFELRSQ